MNFHELCPYIGITDFMDFAQVRNMLDVYKKHIRPKSLRKLHVGVMTSYKVIHGLPNQWTQAFPKPDEIAQIFASQETYNCLHYADYVGREGLSESLKKAIAFGGSGLHAIQLDMTWPDPNEIAKVVHSTSRPLEIILQIGKVAFKEVQENPESLATRLRPYNGIIDRVLLDKSVGKGVEINAEGFISFALRIRELYPHLGLVFAGGLGPVTLHRVEPLIKIFPDASIDAQARLRPSMNAMDPIDWGYATTYLIKGLQLLS